MCSPVQLAPQYLALKGGGRREAPGGGQLVTAMKAKCGRRAPDPHPTALPRHKAGANAVDLPLAGGGMEAPLRDRATCNDDDLISKLAVRVAAAA